jgi:hypothetical protein
VKIAFVLLGMVWFSVSAEAVPFSGSVCQPYPDGECTLSSDCPQGYDCYDLDLDFCNECVAQQDCCDDYFGQSWEWWNENVCNGDWTTHPYCQNLGGGSCALWADCIPPPA